MDAQLLSVMAAKRKAGEDMAVVTVIASNALKDVYPGAVMAIDQYGQIMGGNIGDERVMEKIRREAEKCLGKGISRKVAVDAEEGKIELFINVFCRKERLIIVGSGSLVLDIYQIAIMIGYSITIIDSRPETLTRERFPLASELLLGDVVESLQNLAIDDTASIVLASHHHDWDQAALQAVIGTPARYIGILGNRRKVTAYFNKLNGMDTPEELMNRVHIPIGLDIGGQKTSEIALAAMAEIQAVKYGRPGGFLTIKDGGQGIDKRDQLF